MANWAFIENNQIIETHESLPKNWRNISNLDVSENNKDFLQSLGWYVIEHQHIDYDYNSQCLCHDKLIFTDGKITQTYKILDKNPDVLYTEFMQQIRETRNRLLQESDYMCLYDLVLTREKQYLIDVTEYRKKLRDFPENFPKNNNCYDIFSVVWPTKPILNNYNKINILE